MASTLNETVREDGLRVVTKRLNHTKKVAVSASAGVGLADDHEDKDGLFHFFEHMGFKGTKARPRREMKKQLGKFVNSNAYTSHLHTSYYAEAAYPRLPELQDTILDIYLNSVFPEEEIEKEKEVVFNETSAHENNDSDKAQELLGKLLYARNPVRRVSCGTLEGLKNISKDGLVSARDKFYIPSNTVVAGVGRVEHDKFVKNIFDQIPVNFSRTEKRTWADEADVAPSIRDMVLERKDRTQGVVVWGCKLPQLSDKEQDTMNILSQMIGGGFDSLLFEEVRDKRGYVYEVGSQYWNIENLASGIYFEGIMLPQRIGEVKELILDVVCNYALSEDDFMRTKDVICDSLLVSLESCREWLFTLHKKIIDRGQSVASLENYKRKRMNGFSKITFNEVMSLRSKFITPERMACVVVKPC